MVQLRPVSSPDFELSGPPSSEAYSLSQGSGTLASARACPTCGGRYPANFKVCPQDATPLEDAPADSADPMIGQQLGATYEVLRMIGEGGMGRVYEARHLRLPNKRFAIKMLHQELARQPEVVARFQREAEASSVLAHPNVVSVFDVNVAFDGRPYLVAELLEGDQLGDYLERRVRLPIEQAVRIVRQVCRALGVAHDAGIVHRDVKPENVFLAGGIEMVKVLDFGISKIAEASENLTKTGMVIGTPDYMAPEQARGDKVDARADIYAVGCILYRAVTGQKPYEGLDVVATLTAVLTQEPPRPSSLEPAIPLDLEMVIQRAMAKEPRERYQTMSELDDALAPFDRPSILNLESVPSVRARTSQGQTLADRPGTLVASILPVPRFARPGLLFFGVLGFVWLIGNGIVGAATLMRLVRSSNLTSSESVLVPVGMGAAILTPLVAWIRHVARDIWPNTPKSVELAAHLRKTVLYSACAYAVVLLAAHFVEGVINRKAEGVSQPSWAFAAFVAAAISGGATWFTRKQRKG